MSSHNSPWTNGPEYGQAYLFDFAGEGIPMHAHKEAWAWHFTRCLKGSCEIYGDGFDAVLTAGQELHFPSYRLHELVALQDGTQIANVFYAGMPATWAGMDPACLTGNTQSTLVGKVNFTQHPKTPNPSVDSALAALNSAIQSVNALATSL
jgi:hypothetical protein